jgi:hypothetical protein
MDKGQLITEIRKINSTAQPEFLQQFDPSDLQQYLDHLQAAERKEIRIAGWARKPATKVRMAS